MKLIKYSNLLLILTLLAGMACRESFLEVSPTASLLNQKLATKAGIEGSLIATYAVLSGRQYSFYSGSTNWFWGGVMGGDASKGGDAGGEAQMNEIQRFETQTTNFSVASKYKTSYEGIVRANTTLALLAKASEPISEADRKRMEGEAKFLRGHYYFDLKKNFNNTPWLDENTGSAVVKNDIDLWPKIEADFQYAYENLPEKQVDVGRANKWAAGAYLGKVFLFQRKYDQAKKVMDDVINNGHTAHGVKFELMEKYGDLWRYPTSDNNKETVFAIQAAVGTGHVANAQPDLLLNYPYRHGPSGCCGTDQPSFDLANSFRTDALGLPLLDGSYNQTGKALKSDMGISADSTFTPDSGNLDPRLDHAIGRRGIPYFNYGLFPGASWIRQPSYGGPYAPKKFVFAKGDATESANFWTSLSGNNFPIIRFADVLLMAAEIEVELNNLEKAREYVNQVRTRAANTAGFVAKEDGSPAANYIIRLYDSWANQDEARKAVRFERKLELSDEGHRFYDLVRWGVAKEVLDAYFKNEAANGLTDAYSGATFKTGKSEYLPIPQEDIDLAGAGNLIQNKGYSH